MTANGRLMWRAVLPVLVAALGMSGCEKSPTSGGEKGDVAISALLPAGFFLASAPAGVKDVIAAKKGAKPGERIVVRGRVGGSKEPMATERAIFTIMDLGLQPCGVGKMESCPTPWDYCCDPRDVITKNIATVQVVDSAGRPLKAGLQNMGKLAPLAEVIVEGQVASGSTGDSLVVNASGIFVKPK